MLNVYEIEENIVKLPPDGLVEFRSWYEKFDANQWDKDFENDVISGKLDNLAKNAIKDYKSGNFKKI